VMIASDASSVAVQYNGKIALRDAKTGKPAGEVQLPLGASLGRARQFDGTTLIVGDNELFAIQVRPKIEKKPLWWWKIPATDLASISFAPSGGADPLNFAVGQYDGTVRLMRGSRQVLGSVAQSGGALSVDLSRDGSRFAYVSTTGEAESMSRGKGAWVMNIKHRGAIAFIGNDGDTVIADWLGVVRRLDAKAKEAWRIDLTPQVWRDDIDKILTTLDATPTLRLEAPARDGAPMAGKNLAPDASVALTQARTIGWERPIATLKDGGAVLNNGKADDAERPWFDRDGANYMVGSEYKKPLTWELTWKEPVKLDVLVVRESAAHPESVPEEIAIDAWIEEGDWKGWKRLVHDRWNSGTVHAHPFPAATTKQLRYIVYGDFANNLWTAEIEAYGP